MRDAAEIGFALGAVCAEGTDGAYLAPHHWKGLSQWVRLFGKVRFILQSMGRGTPPPPGWVRIPEHVDVRRVGGYGMGYFARRRAVLRCVGEALNGIQMLLARMPSDVVYWAFRRAASLNIPVLLELHGDWETSARLGEPGERVVKRLLRPLRARLAGKATLTMVGGASAVVTIGPELAKKYVRCQKPLLVSTNHTLDEREYRQREVFGFSGIPRLLFVGELVERKGLRYLFGALNELRRKGKEFRITLVGDGPQKLVLHQYSKDHEFASWVEFAGFVPLGDTLLEYYRSADAFVLPSLAGEGVPRVVHEAMSQGCPVIATDTGSTAWQLRGGAGMVVPPGNVEVLSQTILRVLEDRTVQESLSRSGFERSLEFTFEKQAARIAAFVREHVPAELLK